MNRSRCCLLYLRPTAPAHGVRQTAAGPGWTWARPAVVCDAIERAGNEIEERDQASVHGSSLLSCSRRMRALCAGRVRVSSSFDVDGAARAACSRSSSLDANRSSVSGKADTRALQPDNSHTDGQQERSCAFATRKVAANYTLFTPRDHIPRGPRHLRETGRPGPPKTVQPEKTRDQSRLCATHNPENSRHRRGKNSPKPLGQRPSRTTPTGCTNGVAATGKRRTKAALERSGKERPRCRFVQEVDPSEEVEIGPNSGALARSELHFPDLFCTIIV